MLPLPLIGCATTTETTFKPYEYSNHAAVSREFDAEYDAVWGALVSTIQEMGHPVQTIGKESGLLVTVWNPRAGAPFVMGI